LERLRSSSTPPLQRVQRAADYGFALLKTSAALVYTVQLAIAHGLAVATDSAPHHALLGRTLKRERVILATV
jgi:hypothetical protein